MNKYCIFLTKGYYEYYTGKKFYDKKLGVYYPLTTQDIDDKEVKWYKNRQTAIEVGYRLIESCLEIKGFKINSITQYGCLDISQEFTE
jgi:hypothetical protein